jgi:hypothetical protein
VQAVLKFDALEEKQKQEAKSSRCNAGVAQLVERNLAKVEVASSRLVSRSRIRSGVPKAEIVRRFRC